MTVAIYLGRIHGVNAESEETGKYLPNCRYTEAALQKEQIDDEKKKHEP